MPKDSVRRFIDEFAIAWPCGFSTDLSTIAQFGAFSTDRKVPGYELTPTLYLIGSDGLIGWNDRQSRLRHEDRGPQLKELYAAIDRELARPPKGVTP